MEEKTIAAISTAKGIGGIGIVRISGKKSIYLVDKIFKNINNKKLVDSKGYTAHYGHIIYNNEKVDECIVTVFKAPKSYTGEDVVEISCHGGLYITKKVLEIVLNVGADLSEAGEFTKRAFLNGKLDLTEAEAIMDILKAKGEQATKAALLAKEGALFRQIQKIKNKLVDLTAKLTVWADYPDEEVVEINEEVILNCLLEVENNINKLLSTYNKGKILKEGISTTIVGKPNVGKSTLMNLLSGCERSIVTDIPGTTRDIVEETIILGDIMLCLSDTAGIRNSSDKVEKIGINRAKKQIEYAELVLAVFDSSKPLDKDDFILIDYLKNKNTIVILNKSDLKSKIDKSYLKKELKNIIDMSAISGVGLESLERAINSIINFSDLNPAEGIIANERQANSLRKTLDCIKEIKKDIEIGITFDAITVSIEDAINCILELTGEKVSDVVINEVFSKFCVGK